MAFYPPWQKHQPSKNLTNISSLQLTERSSAITRMYLRNTIQKHNGVYLELVILDEIHHVSGLFPILRGMIDRQRRQGFKVGQYLLLGSASLDALKQSGETLAGRVRYLELSPLNVTEVTDINPNTVWLRGGFPESLLAATSANNLQWRE
jgi:predicted AAA+ superfamily ATPase